MNSRSIDYVTSKDCIFYIILAGVPGDARHDLSRNPMDGVIF